MPKKPWKNPKVRSFPPPCPLKLQLILDILNQMHSIINDACGWVGRLSRVESHLKYCPLRLYPCEYHALIGCPKRILEAQRSKHNEKALPKHFSLSLKLLARLKKKLEELRAFPEMPKIKEVKVLSLQNIQVLCFLWVLSPLPRHIFGPAPSPIRKDLVEQKNTM